MFWFCLLYAKLPARTLYAALWVSMGVCLEFMQGQLGYRTYEVDDMLANALGVLVGWMVSFAIPIGLAKKLR